MTSAKIAVNFRKTDEPGGIAFVPKKVPKERVQFEATAAHVAEWKREAEAGEITLSEFIRRACKRYAKFRKQKREQPDKSDDDSER